MVNKNKPYRKPYISMNRKKYGMARPVRQKKEKSKLVKPKVIELKRIYAKLRKAATWQRLAILAEAMQWYRSAMTYVHQNRLNNPQKVLNEYSTLAARALLAFNDHHKTMVSINIDAEKEHHAFEALKNAQKFCYSQGIKTVAIQPYLKKHKLVAKRLDIAVKKASNKYDKLLTLITQACDSPFTLQIAPKLEQSHKIDNMLKTIFYSTAHIKQLSMKYKKQGLLALVVSEGPVIAKAMSYKEVNKGLFLPDEAVQLKIFVRMMDTFIEWATTSDAAPKNVLRRPRKVKVKKAA